MRLMCNSRFYQEAISHKGKQTFPRTILTFIIAYWVGSMLASLPVISVMMQTGYSAIEELVLLYMQEKMTDAEYQEAILKLQETFYASDAYQLCSMMGTAVLGSVGVFYMSVVEGRPLRQMGICLGKKQIVLTPLFWIMAGFGACLVGGILYISGAVVWSPAKWDATCLVAILAHLMRSGGLVTLVFGAFFPVILSHTKSPVRGCISAAVLFTFLYLPAPGTTVIAVINALLFSVFVTLFTLRVGNLWATWGIVAMWDIILGVGLGSTTSGGYRLPSLLSPTSHAEMVMSHGGDGGFSSGYAATLVLLVMMIVLLYLPVGTHTRQKTGAPTDEDPS